MADNISSGDKRGIWRVSSATNAAEQRDAPTSATPCARDARLVGLTNLASAPIETTLVGDLSGNLHMVFDHVCDTTLPIYFGPLLGRLYLNGL